MGEKSLRPWNPGFWALFLILSGCTPDHSASRSPREIAELRIEQLRPVRPRLAGQARWAPCVGDDTTIVCRRESPGGTDSLRGRDAAKILGLLQGREIDPRYLELPVDSGAAEEWIDRGALLLVAAEHLDRPTLTLRALTATLRAAELARSSAVAQFNLALAFESVGARRQARLAWARFLGLEEDPDWRSEAENRLRFDLGRPSEVESWQQLASNQAEPEGPDLNRALDTPQALMTFLLDSGLETLARAQATADGPKPPSWLLRAPSALAEQASDPFFQDLVEGIASSAADPSYSRSLQLLLESHDALGDHHLSEAMVSLDKAKTTLSRLPREKALPLEVWFIYQDALASYRSGRRPEALEKASLAANEAKRLSYLNLEGRAARLAAVVELDLLHPEAALPWLARAAACFEANGERGRLAAIEHLRATALDDLGRIEGAWHHRLAALRQASRYGDLGRLPMLFGIAALEALELGEGDAALALLTETFGRQMSAKNPVGRTEALWWRGLIHQGRGALDEALRDVRLARNEATAISHETARNSCLAGLWQLEGKLLLESSPAEALEAFGNALDTAEEVRFDYRIAELHRLRAAAALQLGQTDLAERELLAALTSLDAKRGEIESWQNRTRFADQARPVLEDLIQLQLRLGDHAKALQLAGNGRARELRDLWREPAEESTEFDFTEAGAVPVGEVLVIFEVLEKKTLVWRVDSGEMRLFTLGIGRQALRSLADSWTVALRNRKREAPAAHELFVELVRPWLPDLRSTQRLVIVPDEVMARLPFHILETSPEGRLLIEDFELLIAPGAHLAHASWRSARPWPPPTSFLAIAADEPIEGFRELVWARGEIEALGALHPAAATWLGKDSTSDRFAELAGKYEVVHFAGHAESARRSQPSRLLFGPSDDLEIDEIAELDLTSTRLIILSACDTHFDDNIGLEGPLTLATAFLRAGASQTLATLWPVDDRSAREAMGSFHEQLASGERPSSAFRNALILDLNAGEKTVRGKKISAWAPFQLFGLPLPLADSPGQEPGAPRLRELALGRSFQRRPEPRRSSK